MKAIIFDLDGMIFFADRLWSEEFSRIYKIPNEHIQKFFENEFRQCLIGELDTKDELSRYAEKWGKGIAAEDIFNHWFNYGQLDNDMIRLIRHLRKKGIVCILCTNNERYRINHFREKHGFEELFDYIFASSEVGHKKPDFEMFEKIIDRIDISPAEILFCDDDLDNCNAAEEFGFNVHHFSDMAGFQEELRRIL